MKPSKYCNHDRIRGDWSFTECIDCGQIIGVEYE